MLDDAMTWADHAVALVNTRTTHGHEDLLTTVPELRRFVRDRGLLSPRSATDEDLQAVRHARRRLARAFDATSTTERAAALETIVTSSVRVHVSPAAGDRIRLSVERAGAGLGDRLLARCGVALAILVDTSGPGVLADCGAPDCAHVLLRVGAGSPRRFCSSTCASRTRVSRHRARRRATEGRPSGQPPAKPARLHT